MLTPDRPDGPDGTVLWEFDPIESVGGHGTEMVGSVRQETTDQGTFVSFDGVDDGLIVENLPLANAREFTIEILFRPESGGQKEQRFLHLQGDTGGRILIETRLFDGDMWALDTYFKTPAGSHALYDASIRHPLDEWYRAVVVYDGREMRHYVNGKQELATPIGFHPLGPGKVSIGMRMNRVFWFKGDVRSIRFTPRVLSPEEFLGR